MPIKYNFKESCWFPTVGIPPIELHQSCIILLRLRVITFLLPVISLSCPLVKLNWGLLILELNLQQELRLSALSLIYVKNEFPWAYSWQVNSYKSSSMNLPFWFIRQTLTTGKVNMHFNLSWLNQCRKSFCNQFRDSQIGWVPSGK